MWKVYINTVRVDNITADTYMEAELIARILYGTTARLSMEFDHGLHDSQED